MRRKVARFAQDRFSPMGSSNSFHGDKNAFDALKKNTKKTKATKNLQKILGKQSNASSNPEVLKTLTKVYGSTTATGVALTGLGVGSFVLGHLGAKEYKKRKRAKAEQKKGFRKRFRRSRTR